MEYKNSFVITARVATEPTVNTFKTATVKRAAIVINQSFGEGENARNSSALINIECWRKNENIQVLDVVKKGALLTFSGYLKPEEWTTGDGQHHSRVILSVTHIEIPETDDTKNAE